MLNGLRCAPSMDAKRYATARYVAAAATFPAKMLYMHLRDAKSVMIQHPGESSGGLLTSMVQTWIDSLQGLARMTGIKR